MPLRSLLSMPIAHRGLHTDGIPENSMAAFRAAIEARLGIELDVHPVGEDDVAVFHDYDLQRLCGSPALLAEQDRASLARCRLAGTDEHIPVLDEVLELVAGRVPLAIELKRPATQEAAAALCARVARRLRRYTGVVAVMSFDPGLLRWFGRHASWVPRVQLAASRRVPGVAEAARQLGIPRWKELAVEYLAVNALSRPQVVGYDVRALPHPAVRRSRRRGRLLLTGIVTTHSQLATAVQEADGVVFEGLDPALVSDALGDRAADAP